MAQNYASQDTAKFDDIDDEDHKKPATPPKKPKGLYKNTSIDMHKSPAVQSLVSAAIAE